MSPRTYAVVVSIWIVAAIVAVSGTLSRRSAEGTLDATTPLEPWARAPSSFETVGDIPAALQGVVTERVEGTWEGPGGHSFLVAVRTSQGVDPRVRMIGRDAYRLTLRLDGSPNAADCSACHEGSSISGVRGGPSEAVHQNVQPVHPDQTGAECLGCHVEDDVSRLRVGPDQTATTTHAYRLCAQCHFRAVESWAKGAHGKRLVAWRGERVVFGCAECHDPHRPATEVRSPYAGPWLPGPLMGEEEHADDDEGGGH